MELQLARNELNYLSWCLEGITYESGTYLDLVDVLHHLLWYILEPRDI